LSYRFSTCGEWDEARRSVLHAGTLIAKPGRRRR
jgi:hypothetical protein